ncbi:aldehyde dehydrogenase [Pseudovibrio japonicus]|uniref:Aldehyde dehydrogenase n=1 Tax=Pseudovibrio japonicus TaxID=366534 RepID=A0ABQ3EHW2_9HYPH|nr:aldehyde dehydrogenase family protein [Pseudovibrio japonicus]GHB34650.1 aldehyde dehydrogenase [Pseudovibrio japonicus]
MNLEINKSILTASLAVINPATGAVIANLPTATNGDVESAISAAQIGLKKGRRMSRARRAEILLETAKLVNENAEDFAQTIVRESGKTIRQAAKEVMRCVNTLTLSAEEAKRLTGEIIPFDSFAGSENRHGYFTREPLGIILAITPFNDPLNLIAHKLGPALAGGNSVILKPSALTPLSAIKLAECFYEAGLPREMLTVVIGGSQIGDALVRRNEIRMVSFTGGSNTGETISHAAGLKRTAMDLGGNAPVIILSDCEIELAVSSCVSGAFWAAGQNCVGVQRIFVHQEIYEKFLKMFVAETKKLRCGDPMDQATDVGPMITETEAIRIEQWVNEAIASGATAMCGHNRTGAFYAPTILVNVDPGSKINCEEVFAPVVLISGFSDLDEVILDADKPEFALHAAVFSNDISNIQKVIDGLDVGGIMVNDSSDYRFDGMPFGGSKRGSMGREGVKFALEEMTQTKVVCYNHSSS